MSKGLEEELDQPRKWARKIEDWHLSLGENIEGKTIERTTTPDGKIKVYLEGPHLFDELREEFDELADIHRDSPLVINGVQVKGLEGGVIILSQEGL